MCNINMCFHGNNAICVIIFDESFMQNITWMIENVTNFLWSQSINDVTQHLWVLEINGKIIVKYKKPPTN